MISKRIRRAVKAALLAPALLALTLALTACFKDKGGMGSNSVLNLTPQQQLHAVIQQINESKALVVENEVRQAIQQLERVLRESSGETKYRAIYYLTWLRVFYAELLARRGQRDNRAGLDLLRFAQKDVDHFRKAGYKPDEHRFLTGLIQSARLEFETDRERRAECWRLAKGNLAKILRKRDDFETEFKIADVAFRKPDVMLALARTHRRFEDALRAFETLDELSRKYPLHAKSPLTRIERAYLLVQVGDLEGAAAELAEFKGSAYKRDLFYEEGLWLLQGIYAMLAKNDPKYALDEKTLKGLLKDSPSFFAKGAGPVEKYVLVRERAYREYGRAVRMFLEGRAAEALAVAYDIVDDAKARGNEIARLEASESTVELAHALAARCLESTRSAGPDEIGAHLEAAGAYADTAEVDVDAVAREEQPGSQGTIEAALDLKALLVGTAETQAAPGADSLPVTPPPPALPLPVPPRPGL